MGAVDAAAKFNVSVLLSEVGLATPGLDSTADVTATDWIDVDAVCSTKVMDAVFDPGWTVNSSDAWALLTTPFPRAIRKSPRLLVAKLISNFSAVVAIAG